MNVVDSHHSFTVINLNDTVDTPALNGHIHFIDNFNGKSVM